MSDRIATQADMQHYSPDTGLAGNRRRDVTLPEERTELANARRFIERHGDKLRYVPPWDKWIVWRGTHWQIDDGCQVEALARDVIEEVWHGVFQFVRQVERSEASAMLSFAKATASAHGIEHFLSLARSEPGIPIQPAELDKNEWLLNVQNGTIDLRTGKRRAHDKADYITDNGIWRRLRLVPFTVTIPPKKQDKTLGEKLKRESTGILTWAIQGCLAWQADGLQEPSRVLLATDQYRDEQDVSGDFFDELCTFGPTAKVAGGKFYEAYAKWCIANGHDPDNSTVFGRKLSERGFPAKKDSKEIKMRCGIGLTHDFTADDLRTVYGYQSV